MAERRSSFPASRRLFFLLLQLACFVLFPPAAASNQPLPPPARRKVVSRSVSVRSYIRHLLSFSRSTTTTDNKQQRQQQSPERAKFKQLRHYLVHPERTEPAEEEPEEQDEARVHDAVAAAATVKCRPSLACPSCGELVSNKVELLELHQATKHAFSELPDGDPGNNIVRIIFQSGWKGAAAPPLIRRILKIHHSPSALARFEQCRHALRSRRGVAEAERCAVDGNERLRFYCATFLCRLDGESAGTCGSPFCSACWIVRQGFSGKEAAAEGGISTHATARAAHSSLPEDLEREFAFLRIRRAMLICRVLAGRQCPLEVHEPSAATDGETGSYDSAERARDELIVFNPRAALPCFVVIYNNK